MSDQNSDTAGGGQRRDAEGNSSPSASNAAVLIERIGRLLRAAEHASGLNPAQWEALRYLARCNRFSNSPSALSDYLATTKGTVSQTLIALERHGLLLKQRRPRERRSIALVLTEAGREMLQRDPWFRLAQHEKELPAAVRDGLRSGLQQFVRQELAHQNLKGFGICAGCRHFQRDASGGHPFGAHFCGLLQQPLSDDDSAAICAEHVPA